MSKNIFNGKNCLISGATGGIGKEIAFSLAAEGCNLYLTSQNLTKLKELAKKIKISNTKINVKYQSTNLKNTQDIKKLIRNIRKDFFHIDILINSAGKFLIKPIEKCTIEDLEETLDINMKAPFILTKEFSEDMKKRGWGRIINLGSSSSYDGFPKGSIYCLTKHAILGFSRSIHEELKKKGVRTFCISPASTKTEMAKLSTDQDFSTFLDPKEVAKFIIQTISYDENLVANEVRLNRMEIK